MIKTTLTLEDIENLIVREDAYTLGKKTTAVVLTLENGFEVVGLSACVDPANYDIEKGKPFARQRALDEVWKVAGYKLQADIYENMEDTPDSDGEFEGYQAEQAAGAACAVNPLPASISFDDDDIPF